MGKVDLAKELEIGQKAWDMVKQMECILNHEGKQWKGEDCIMEKLVEEMSKNKAGLVVLQLIGINLASKEATVELKFLSVGKGYCDSNVIIALPTLDVLDKNLTDILPKLKQMIRKNFLVLAYIWVYDLLKSIKNY